MELTKQQRALLTLVRDGMLDEVVALIGLNHPTAKWFQRETGWKLVDMSEEKRYYDSPDGIVEFPAALSHRRNGITANMYMNERDYQLLRNGLAKLPPTIAESAIAMWKLQREHPAAERILRCDKALDDNGWILYWDRRNGYSVFCNGQPVEPNMNPHSVMAGTCYPTRLAAVEAAIEATEKAKVECWRFAEYSQRFWLRGTSEADCQSWDKCGHEDQSRLSLDYWVAAHNGQNPDWKRQTLAEQEAELAEARAKQQQQEPFRCCQADFKEKEVAAVTWAEFSATVDAILREAADRIVKAGGGE